jgi:hypothetical protein
MPEAERRREARDLFVQEMKRIWARAEKLSV